MNTKTDIDYFALEMTDTEFSQFQELVVRETGILLNPAKRALVMNRLRRFLMAGKLSSYGEYYRQLRSCPHHEDLAELIASITTSTTEFFRDRGQIEYFSNPVIPLLERDLRKGTRTKVKIWSAGCSTGEEPYTLSIVINESVPRHKRDRYEITASDINPVSLEKAKQAVYNRDELKKVERKLLKRYFYQFDDSYQACSLLTGMVKFNEFNLVEKSTWPKDLFDVIFCRNVLIYMREDIKKNLIRRFLDRLRNGGFLFLGHSETIYGLDVPLTYVHPAIYRKEE